MVKDRNYQKTAGSSVLNAQSVAVEERDQQGALVSFLLNPPHLRFQVK